jgi:hypothetical protein
MDQMLLVLSILVFVAGCSGHETISCDTNGDCLQGEIGGTCVMASTTTQWCGFPDPGCDSGLRWGVASGEGLAVRGHVPGDGRRH